MVWCHSLEKRDSLQGLIEQSASVQECTLQYNAKGVQSTACRVFKCMMLIILCTLSIRLSFVGGQLKNSLVDDCGDN